MRSFVAIVFALCISAAARTDDAKNELDRLQGEWEIVRVESGGKVLPLEKVHDKHYTLKGAELIPSKNPKDPGKLDLKPEKKPAWVDLTDRNMKTMHGIYRVDDDRWEICLSGVKGERPTDFKTAPGSKSHLMVLKRKKM